MHSAAAFTSIFVGADNLIVSPMSMPLTVKGTILPQQETNIESIKKLYSPKEIKLLNKKIRKNFVSVDKDLKQLAGMHLNLVSRKFEDVSEDYARLFFWRQMLQGDSADNIKGITGIGEVKSRRYIPDGIHDSKAQKIVSSFYKKEYEEDWRETYNRNAKLLWIWRKIPDDCPHTLEEKQEVFHSTV